MLSTAISATVAVTVSSNFTDKRAVTAQLKAQVLDEHTSGRLNTSLRAIVEENRLHGVALAQTDS